MRIAIVTDTWPPEVNGVALTVHGLAHGLAGLGHSVEVIRPQQPGSTAAGDTDGLVHLQVPSLLLPRYRGLRVGLPIRQRLLRRWRSQLPDAIYLATEGPLGHSALAAAEALDIPTCSGLHTRFDQYAGHYGMPRLQDWVLAGMRRFHNRAGATLVPTQALAGQLRTLGFTHVQQLPRAVDNARFHPGLHDPQLRRQWGAQDDSLLLLHVGRMAAEKNLPLLIRADAAIRQAGIKLHTVIVGDGPLRASLQASHRHIHFTGTLHGQQLASAFASADLFVFPSLSETFGNVTLEAMASGLPVVAYDYGAAGEHILSGSTGLSAACDDEPAFLAACLQLAGDAGLRARLGAQARARMLQLSPENVSQDFAGLLRSLNRLEAA